MYAGSTRMLFRGSLVKHHSGKVNLSTAGGLAALVLWSLTVALARRLSEQLGPLTAGACVYLIGGALCLVPLARRRGPVWGLVTSSPRYVFGCGFLFVLYTAVLFLAVGLAADRSRIPSMDSLMTRCLATSMWAVRPTQTLVAGILLPMPNRTAQPILAAMQKTIRQLLGMLVPAVCASAISAPTSTTAPIMAWCLAACRGVTLI